MDKMDNSLDATLQHSVITKMLGKCTRVEVIDDNGRSYVKYLKKDQLVEISMQDDGRTMKVFIVKDESKQ